MGKPRQTKPTMTPYWMPLYIATHVADTSRQSPAEHGAYMRLICDYWRNGPPRNDDKILARITGMSMKEWLDARPEVERFFDVDDEWINRALDAELARAYEQIKKNSARTENATYARKLKREAENLRNEQRYVPRNDERAGNVTLSQDTSKPKSAPAKGVKVAQPSTLKADFFGSITTEKQVDQAPPSDQGSSQGETDNANYVEVFI